MLGPAGELESVPVPMPLTSDLDSAVHWINPAGGDWNEPTNWSTGFVPIPFQDIILDAAGTYEITSSHDVRIDSLMVAAGVTLAITGGTFKLIDANDEPLKNAGTISVGSGGTLIIGNAGFAETAINTGTLQATGGTINLINLSVTNTGGQINVDGLLTLNTVSITNGNLHVLSTGKLTSAPPIR